MASQPAAGPQRRSTSGGQANLPATSRGPHSAAVVRCGRQVPGSPRGAHSRLEPQGEEMAGRAGTRRGRCRGSTADTPSPELGPRSPGGRPWGGGLGPVLPAVPWPSGHSAASTPACPRRHLPGAHLAARPEAAGSADSFSQEPADATAAPSKENPGGGTHSVGAQKTGVRCAGPRKRPPHSHGGVCEVAESGSVLAVHVALGSWPRGPRSSGWRGGPWVCSDWSRARWRPDPGGAERGPGSSSWLRGGLSAGTRALCPSWCGSPATRTPGPADAWPGA